MAECYGKKACGLLLSGANADGTEGLKRIKAFGGLAIVQDPATAEVPFMPDNAVAFAPVDHVLPLNGIIEKINSL